MACRQVGPQVAPSGCRSIANARLGAMEGADASIARRGRKRPRGRRHAPLATPASHPGEHHDDASAPRRVWHATLLQALGRFWSAACTLTLLYLAADALPLAAFGRFTFYLAVFALLDSLANMGTGQVAVQWT